MAKKTPASSDPVARLRGAKRKHYEQLTELHDQLIEKIRIISGRSLTSAKAAGEELADIGSDNFMREMELGLMTEEERKLKMVREAIQKLLSGKQYGICADCKKKIQPARLEALPYAKLCIECKSKREKAKKMGVPLPENWDKLTE